MDHDALMGQFPPAPPQVRLAWTAVVEVGEKLDIGPCPEGERFLVPITGGRFRAGPGIEGLSGAVLAGGADRQVLRPDGIRQLEALYEMQTDCGAVLTIRNSVIVDAEVRPDRYALSTLSVTAPEGRFAWLNRRIFVGTLQSARPKLPAVVVRAWEGVPGPASVTDL